MADPALNPEERFTYGDYRRWPEGERWELIDGQAWCMSPAPTFVIEVLSPSTAKKDITHKFSLYERHGVKEYWIVDPDARVVHAWSLEGNGKYGEERLYVEEDRAVSTALDGFAVDLKKCFAEIQP